MAKFDMEPVGNWLSLQCTRFAVKPDTTLINFADAGQVELQTETAELQVATQPFHSGTEYDCLFGLVTIRGQTFLQSLLHVLNPGPTTNSLGRCVLLGRIHGNLQNYRAGPEWPTVCLSVGLEGSSQAPERTHPLRVMSIPSAGMALPRWDSELSDAVGVVSLKFRTNIVNRLTADGTVLPLVIRTKSANNNRRRGCCNRNDSKDDDDQPDSDDSSTAISVEPPATKRCRVEVIECRSAMDFHFPAFSCEGLIDDSRALPQEYCSWSFEYNSMLSYDAVC